MPKPLYEILKLNNEQATKEEIAKAYKKLALQLHPDKNPAEDAQARFQEVQKAHEILIDDESRGRYDRGEIDEKGQPVMYSKRPTPTPTAPHLMVKKAGKDTGVYLEPLVPIQEIINKFNTFKEEKLLEKNSQGDLKYSQNSFTHEKMEGPPTVHIFTFPDQASADQFIKQLLQDKMVSYARSPQESAQQTIKDSLSALKSAEPSASEEHDDTPTPPTR